MPSTLDADSPFHKWFQDELDERHWTVADVAREASDKLGKQVFPSGIGQILRRQKRLALTSARYIAAGLGVPVDLVMEMGGLKAPAPKINREHTYLLSIFDDLSEESQQQLLAQAKFLRSRESKKHNEAQKKVEQNPVRGKSSPSH